MKGNQRDTNQFGDLHFGKTTHGLQKNATLDFNHHNKSTDFSMLKETNEFRGPCQCGIPRKWVGVDATPGS